MFDRLWTWLESRLETGPRETLEIDETAVARRMANGKVERAVWAELEEVGVFTTSDGPFIEDVYFYMKCRDGTGCLVSQELAVLHGKRTGVSLIDRLLRLPGFDHERFVRAMGSTDDARFVCWKRDGLPGSAFLEVAPASGSPCKALPDK